MTRHAIAVMLAALLLISTHARTTDAPAAIERVGIITTVAGDGYPQKFQGELGVIEGRFTGDNGPATKASLWAPRAVVVGPDGSLYIADTGNHRIRKVDNNGIITTVAGGARARSIGDGGPATQASLSTPLGVTVTADGTLYIADSGHNRVRKVDTTGIVTTMAGCNGMTGFSGDGGPATKAELSRPRGVALGQEGSIYISEQGNNCVRRVDPNGIITTLAGDGHPGYSGDGMPATRASIHQTGVATGLDGSLYIADIENNRIRKVDSRGIITTVAGGGLDIDGKVNDGIPATKATLNWPVSVIVGPDGSLYIAEIGGHCIRKVDPRGIITTVAGSGTQGYSGDGGPATRASLNQPSFAAVARDGSLYIADTGNNRIRKVTWR